MGIPHPCCYGRMTVFVERRPKGSFLHRKLEPIKDFVITRFMNRCEKSRFPRRSRPYLWEPIDVHVQAMTSRAINHPFQSHI